MRGDQDTLRQAFYSGGELTELHGLLSALATLLSVYCRPKESQLW